MKIIIISVVLMLACLAYTAESRAFDDYDVEIEKKPKLVVCIKKGYPCGCVEGATVRIIKLNIHKSNLLKLLLYTSPAVKLTC